MCATPILHASLVFGLMRLGAATVSLRSAKVPAGIKVDAILTDDPAALHRPWDDHRSSTTHGSPGTAHRRTMRRIYPGSEDDTCRIILTSGSTGEAKGIAVLAQDADRPDRARDLFEGAAICHCSRAVL